MVCGKLHFIFQKNVIFLHLETKSEISKSSQCWFWGFQEPFWVILGHSYDFGVEWAFRNPVFGRFWVIFGRFFRNSIKMVIFLGHFFVILGQKVYPNLEKNFKKNVLHIYTVIISATSILKFTKWQWAKIGYQNRENRVFYVWGVKNRVFGK